MGVAGRVVKVTYQHDNDNPHHVSVVQDRRLPEVADLMKHDTEAM